MQSTATYPLARLVACTNMHKRTANVAASPWREKSHRTPAARREMPACSPGPAGRASRAERAPSHLPALVARRHCASPAPSAAWTSPRRHRASLDATEQQCARAAPLEPRTSGFSSRQYASATAAGSSRASRGPLAESTPEPVKSSVFSDRFFTNASATSTRASGPFCVNLFRDRSREVKPLLARSILAKSVPSLKALERNPSVSSEEFRSRAVAMICSPSSWRLLKSSINCFKLHLRAVKAEAHSLIASRLRSRL